MHFKVSGTQHQTSARAVLEIDAPNRVAAERAANRQGIDVLHVEHVSDDPLEQAMAHEPRASHRGEFPTVSGNRKWMVALATILVVVAVALIFWSRTRGR